ncbi:MFS general substrate transporter [Patellaria atrata CBS 101060]|uniref:MFS general substrate transporter n=1 Tax=Patellaria atrata CBS 101060 TaxID=1346257 RepID=A0A9P4S9G1_9PEZI|nr:MFS general substrate transporter [Patellaria atrata CBS 101060]
MESTSYHPIGQADTLDDDGVELESLGQNEPDELSADAQRARRKPAVIYLLVFFTINSLAFGIVAVPRINLKISLVCRQMISDAGIANVHTLARADEPLIDPSLPVVIGGYNPQCSISEVSSLVALIDSYGHVISGILSAIMCTMLGSLSDRIGRVKIMAGNIVVTILSEAVLVTIAEHPDVFHYYWILLVFAVDGICGSFALVMAMSSAYISDCTAREKRAVYIGRVYSAMFIGIGVGPLISGYITSLAGNDHPLLVFYLCMFMRGLSVLYMLFVPESLAAPISGWKPHLSTLTTAPIHIHTLLNLLARLNPHAWLTRLVPPSPTSPTFRRNVVLLLLINMLIYTAAMGPSEPLILYPQLVFHWRNLETNLFMSTINFSRAAISAFALPLLIRFFTHKSHPPPSSNPSTTPPGPAPLDSRLLSLAILTDLAGYLAYALAPTGVLFTLAGVLSAFGAVGLALTEATLTKHVGGDRVGELMGGLGLLQGLVRIFAPGVCGVLFAWSAGWMPGLVFVCVAAILGFAAAGVRGVKVVEMGQGRGVELS